MKLLLDNDIIKKMVAMGVLEDALALFGATLADVRVLVSCQYRMLKKEARRRREFGDELYEQLAQLLPTLTTLPALADSALVDQLVTVPGIDVGEAELLAAMVEDPSAILLTGDKRFLKALSESPELASVRTAVRNRVCCLEAVMQAVLDATDDYQELSTRVRAGTGHDKTMKVCFGQASAKTRDHSVAALRVEVQAIQTYANAVLYVPVLYVPP